MKIRISEGFAGFVGLVLSIPLGIWLLNVQVPTALVFLMVLAFGGALTMFTISGCWLLACFEDDSFNETLWTISFPISETNDKEAELEAVSKRVFNQQLQSMANVLNLLNHIESTVEVEPTLLTAEQVKAYIRSKDIYGLISWRAWRYADQFLWGTGNGGGYRWQSTNKNDIKPSEANDVGFYSYELGSGAPDSNYAGLIENRGKILCHTDNIIRSEGARILFLYAPDKDMATIQQNYPDVMVTTQYNDPLIHRCLKEEGWI